jgi:GrpB-like predicted nucleotidyltransferase (UPF0157 family)
MTAAPDIAVPAIGSKPNTGIHRSLIKGTHRFRVWWWENGITRSRILPRTVATIEQAREARDRIYSALVAAGASKRNKGAKTPQARIRNARLRGSNREPYISVTVSVRGTHVGSYPTWGEAVAARDKYLKEQNEIRRRLKELKRAMA